MASTPAPAALASSALDYTLPALQNPSKCKWATATTLAVLVTFVAICALTGLVASPLIAIGVSAFVIGHVSSWTSVIACTSLIFLARVKWDDAQVQAKDKYLKSLLASFSDYVKSDELNDLVHASRLLKIALKFDQGKTYLFVHEITRPLTPQFKENLERTDPLLLVLLQLNNLKVSAPTMDNRTFFEQCTNILLIATKNDRALISANADNWFYLPLSFLISERGAFEFTRHVIERQPIYNPALVRFLTELCEDETNLWNTTDEATGFSLYGLAAQHGAIDLTLSFTNADIYKYR